MQPKSKDVVAASYEIALLVYGYNGPMQQKSKDVVAAYEIALFVAEQKQPHTIAKSLILPGAKILVKRVFGEQAVAKLNAVSLFCNTMRRRIEKMSDDIADQVLAEIKESKFGFAIQLDESTDITNYCQLLVYVRYAQTNIMKTESRSFYNYEREGYL